MQIEIEQPVAPLLSATQIREILTQALEKNFTGLGLISFAPGEELTLLIQAGQVMEILLKTQSENQRLAGELWAEQLNGIETARLTMLPASGHLLTFERARFSSAPKEIRENVTGAELGKLLAKLNNHESASLVCLRWPASQAYHLVSGGKVNLQRTVLIQNNQAREAGVETSLIQHLPETPCQFELYQGGLESEPWIALHLNLLFEFFCAHLLTQYGYLTGKVMVNSIIKNILIYASQHDWELSAAEGRIFDQTLFASLDDLKLAYRAMLNLIQIQMHSMAGTNLVTLIKNQGLDRLNTFYLNLWNFSGLDA